jgi:hypothetical protein
VWYICGGMKNGEFRIIKNDICLFFFFFIPTELTTEGNEEEERGIWLRHCLAEKNQFLNVKDNNT